MTVDLDSYYVHFASTRHLFEPVPVGGTSPPVQVYELYNGGSRVVKYELDMEPLAQVQAVSLNVCIQLIQQDSLSSFDFEILTE